MGQLTDRWDALVRALQQTRLWRKGVAPVIDSIEVERLRRRHAESFAAVERFVFFIGYPRSGHTLVGSLLNAHPDAMVAHELNALAYLDGNTGAARLFGRILQRDQWFASRGRRWTGYDYSVEGGWQGRWRRLRVIGDKRGGRSTLEIAQRPDLVARLRHVVGVPILAIHHVRDPYDNIASMVTHARRTLPNAITGYFALVDKALAAMSLLTPDERFELHHEDLVADPRARLAELATRLGLEPEPAWLEACAALVHPSARRSRDQLQWPAELVAEVARRMAAYPHLARYLRDPGLADGGARGADSQA